MKNRIRKMLVVGIIIFLLSTVIRPITSIKISQVDERNQIESIKTLKDIEPKEHLFETIIEIANTPDVKELLKKYNDKLFIFESDYKDVFRQLLFKNPRLLFSMLITKPSITYNYLNFVYEKGCEIVNIIGENEAIKIISLIKIKNPEVFDKCSNIILNNEKLFYKINGLNIFNNELKTNPPLRDYPIICTILFFMLLSVDAVYRYYYDLAEEYDKSNPILAAIFQYICYNLALIMLFIMFPFDEYNCDDLIP